MIASCKELRRLIPNGPMLVHNSTGLVLCRHSEDNVNSIYFSDITMPDFTPLLNFYNDETFKFTASSYKFEEYHYITSNILHRLGFDCIRAGPTRVLIKTPYQAVEYYQGLRFDMQSQRFTNPLPPIAKTENPELKLQFNNDAARYAVILSTYLKLTGDKDHPVVLSFTGDDIKTCNISDRNKGTPTEAAVRRYIRHNLMSLRREYGVYDNRG